MPKKRRNIKGTVYLLHLDRPLHHARHYTGWTEGELDTRLEVHRAGNGARLLEVCRQLGIGWTLVRTYRNVDRREERRLKQHGASRRCPICCGTLLDYQI